jgi:hypothetical protein
VAAWRASAVREGVMGLKSDNDWFSPAWSVHVTEFLAYFASAARCPPHHSGRLHLLLAMLVGPIESADSMALSLRSEMLSCCEFLIAVDSNSWAI